MKLIAIRLQRKHFPFLPHSFKNLLQLSVYYPEQSLYAWNIDTLTVKEWVDVNIESYDSAFILFQRLENAVIHKNEKKHIILLRKNKKKLIQRFN